MRIVHLSDIHVWLYTLNPLRLMSKRAVGMMELLAGRARKFRLERLREVIEQVSGLAPDHVLITGDLSTTALADEFRDARAALAPLLADPSRVTVIPGNHDRYTTGSVRHQQFERQVRRVRPARPVPLAPPARRRDGDPGPRRHPAAHLGERAPAPQAVRAGTRLLADPRDRPRRLIVACHYPLVAPAAHASELHPKRMKNAEDVARWLAGIGPHLFCCGHVHAAWAFVPDAIPGQLCLNAGAPLLRDPTGLRRPASWRSSCTAQA